NRLIDRAHEDRHHHRHDDDAPLAVVQRRRFRTERRGGRGRAEILWRGLRNALRSESRRAPPSALIVHSGATFAAADACGVPAYPLTSVITGEFAQCHLRPRQGRQAPAHGRHFRESYVKRTWWPQARARDDSVLERVGDFKARESLRLDLVERH